MYLFQPKENCFNLILKIEMLFVPISKKKDIKTFEFMGKEILKNIFNPIENAKNPNEKTIFRRFAKNLIYI